MKDLQNKGTSRPDIVIRDVVWLKNGRRGRVFKISPNGEIVMVSGRSKEQIPFHSEDVINIVRKRVRIYQIEPKGSEYMFMSYDFVKSQGFSAPPAEQYKVVYDGRLATNHLEEIFHIFNEEHLEGYNGRSMSTSDIIELYDDKSSSFFYCDIIGFKKIRFKPVKLWYMLMTINERDIIDMQIFSAIEEARYRMKKELLNCLNGSFDDFTENEDYGLGNQSAWANYKSNWDWAIIQLTADKAMRIKAAWL